MQMPKKGEPGDSPLLKTLTSSAHSKVRHLGRYVYIRSWIASYLARVALKCRFVVLTFWSHACSFRPGLRLRKISADPVLQFCQ